MRAASVAILVLRLGTLLCAAMVGVALFVDLPDLAIAGRSFDALLLCARLLVVLLVGMAVAERDALARWAASLGAGGAVARGEHRVVWILVLAGFALRFARFHEFGFNPDEAQFVWFGAADTLADVWRYELAKSPHPPANFFLMHGILDLTWSRFWLRLPAVLSGTFLIWATHRFVRPLFGPLAGLAAAFLVAFSPGLVDLSRVCRNYAPGFAVLVAALVFFVAYLRSERWRDYAIFCGLAPLAAFWHYGFVTVFVGIDLALAITLLWRRRPASAWLRVVVGQLPLAAVLLGLYVTHVAGLERTIVPTHQRFYADMLDISPAAFLEPIAGVWRYLMKEPAAAILLVLSVVGCVDLALRRRGTELTLCLFPPAVAYGLAVAGWMPLGATRHSAYLFPFFFGLAASQVPRLLDGYGRPRWRPAGAAVVLGIGAVVLNGSFHFYTSDAGWSPLDPQKAGRELMSSYRQSDVDRANALLEERFAEGDVVMLGFQGLMALRMRFEMSPLLDPTPEQARRGDIRIGHPRSPLRHEHAGVHYFWTRKLTVAPRPETLLRGVRHVRAKFGLPRPSRVWMIRGAWEGEISRLFAALDADVQFDREIHEASNGILFAIPFDELVRVGTLPPRLTPEKRVD